VLQAKERALTLYSSTVFYLGLTFESFKELGVRHKQTSFPIIFNGVGLISTSTITPTTYLGNWAFIILIIGVRSMVNQPPFLFEALAQVNNNTFLF